MLAIAPWTRSGIATTLRTSFRALGVWMANAFVRGAVTGVGLVTAIAGLRDLSGVDPGPQRGLRVDTPGAVIALSAAVAVPGDGSAGGGP